jgi:hypothetical protein
MPHLCESLIRHPFSAFVANLMSPQPQNPLLAGKH